ncbi:hypothetical protein IWW57_001257 [Coemansia sp. S610]|nr:hypothetical protein IWW57_001257 [Coemansia sp. S610]
MSSPSSLQMLPLLIVRKVVEYLEGRSGTSFNPDIDAHNKAKAVIAPLLFVGERWRVAALESICDNCQLTFNHSRQAVEVTIPAWPTTFTYPQYCRSKHVKRVVVKAALWEDMCDGVFSEVMSMVQYENLSFPFANTLSILFGTDPDEHQHDSTEISQPKVVDFARSLLQLTPAVGNIIVGLYHFCDFVPEHSRLYSMLASELYQGSVTGLEVCSRLVDQPPLELCLHGTLGLTSITHESGITCAPFVQLAYLNADTLKRLSIKPAARDDWLRLIYGDTDAPAIFTSLTQLNLDIADTPYDTAWPAIEGVVPFPALSTLVLEDEYPFDDDLLFRGNGETLQTLQIPFSAVARNILGRFGVLERCGVTQMRSVSIGHIYDADLAFMSENANLPIRRQVHRILEVAASLCIQCDVAAFPLLKTLKAAPKTSILQYLTYSQRKLSLGGVIALVAALPGLVRLSCNYYGIGAEVKRIPEIERPSRLHAKYYPLSSNFRVLHISHAAQVSAKDIAYGAMLLAILCPNLVQVDIPPKVRNDFGREVAWATFNDPFKPYAASIGRLVYREVKS